MRTTSIVLSELQSAQKRPFVDIVADCLRPETVDNLSPNDTDVRDESSVNQESWE